MKKKLFMLTLLLALGFTSAIVMGTTLKAEYAKAESQAAQFVIEKQIELGINYDIFTAGQKKYYGFKPASDGCYTFETISNLDTSMQLYASNDIPLLAGANNNYGNNNDEKDSFLLKANTQYILELYFNNNGSGFLPFNVTKDSNDIVQGTQYTTSHSYNGQRNYFVFTPLRNEKYEIHINDSLYKYVVLLLMDSNRNILASFNTNIDGYVATIKTPELVANEKYMIVTYCIYQSATFKFSIQQGPIEIGKVYTITISKPGERVRVTFDIKQYRNHTFQTFGNFDTCFTIRDAWGELVGNYDNDRGDGRNEKETLLLYLGRYTIDLYFYSSTTTGTFTFSITEDNAMIMDKLYYACIIDADEKAYFKFTAPYTGQFIFQTFGSRYTNPVLTLKDSIGSIIGHNDDWNYSEDYYNAKITINLIMGNTYTLEAYLYSSTATDVFFVSVRQNDQRILKVDTYQTINLSASDGKQYFYYTPSTTSLAQFYASGSQNIVLNLVTWDGITVSGFFGQSGVTNYYYYADEQLNSGMPYILEVSLSSGTGSVRLNVTKL